MYLTVINGCDASNMLCEKTVEKVNMVISEYNMDARWIHLSEYPLQYCKGCDYCHTINPGLCAFADGQNDILRQYVNSDTVVIITPVEFGSCSSRVKNFIDRTQPLFLPFQKANNKMTVMQSRYPHYPKLVIIGIKENGEDDIMESFSAFVSECSLVKASSIVEVVTVTGEADVDALKNMKVGSV